MPDTTHIPAGDYPNKAPVHHLDLALEAQRLLEKLPGHRRQTRNLAREAGVSVLMMAMETGDILRDHATDGVVTVQLLSGRATLASDNEHVDLRKGHLAVLQPGVRHDVTAGEQSVLLLTITGGNE
ncbi:MAG: AraC family ligand binding domain-containing protein [Dehalococcoidia bacterium]|nr:AraC family ligand binding domain-containing protein [Dehalococcoidia bacterium]